MTIAADPTQLLLGRGKAYFDRFDASGNSTGLRFLGEVAKLELTPTVQTKDRFTSTKAAGTKIAHNITQQTHTLAIEMLEYQADNIALALLGDNITLTQSGGSITAETVSAAPTAGKCYQLANRIVSALVLTTGAGGVTPVVIGTDYEIVDATIGLIHILPGSTVVTSANPLKAAYTAGAIAGGKQVQGGTVGKIQGRLVYIADPANGPGHDAEFWRVQIEPSGALAFLTDDYGSIPIKGELIDDSANHPTQPLYRITLR